MSVQANDGVDRRSTLDLRSSVLRDNREMALQVVGTDATVRDTVIRDTRTTDTGDGGRGIQLASHDEFLTPCHLDATSLLIERCHEGGVVVF